MTHVTQYRARIVNPIHRDSYDVVIIRDEFERDDVGQIRDYTSSLVDSEGNFTEFEPYALLEEPTLSIPGLVVMNIDWLRRVLDSLVGLVKSMEDADRAAIVQAFNEGVGVVDES